MNHEQLKKDFSQIGRSCWWYLILQFILSFFLTFIFLSLSFSMIQSNSLPNLEFQTNLTALITLLSTVLAPIIVITLKKKSLRWNFSKEYFQCQYSPKIIFKSYAFILGINFGLGFILALLSGLLQNIGISPIEGPDISISNQLFYNILLGLDIVIVAPIFEEIFFRGLILQSLQRYDKNLAIFASALLFSLLHLNIAQSIPAFFSGLIFGYLTIKFHSLSLPILVHMLNNAIAFGISNSSSSLILGFYSILCIIALFYVIYSLISFIKKHPNIDISIQELKTWMTRPSVLSFVIFCIFFCSFSIL